jgi:hypothetical protein
MQAARSQSWRERTAVVGDEDPLDGPVAASEAHERLQRASRHVGRGEERSCLQSRCRWEGDSPQELRESDATPTYRRSLPRSRARRRFRHTPAAELPARTAGPSGKRRRCRRCYGSSVRCSCPTAGALEGV